MSLLLASWAWEVGKGSSQQRLRMQRCIPLHRQWREWLKMERDLGAKARKSDTVPGAMQGVTAKGQSPLGLLLQGRATRGMLVAGPRRRLLAQAARAGPRA